MLAPGPDCKKAVHTQARRRTRTLDRLSASGEAAGPIVLTQEQAQKVRKVLAGLATFLARHRADYEAVRSRPRNQVSKEAGLYVSLADHADGLLDAVAVSLAVDRG